MHSQVHYQVMPDFENQLKTRMMQYPCPGEIVSISLSALPIVTALNVPSPPTIDLVLFDEVADPRTVFVILISRGNL